MKKILLIPMLLAAFMVKAQQSNTLLTPDFWKTTPDVATVKTEIAKGNSPTQFNPATFDAAVLAINNDAPNATIKYLIEQPGNSVKKLTHDGRIYLHWAASRGNLELVQYLLAKGSDITLEDSHGSTPVVFAANAGQANTAIYDAFIKAGLDIKKKYADGANLLLLAIANDKDLKLTNYFISKGLSLKDVDSKGNTAFNYAAKSATVAQLKALIQKGVKYNDNALLFAAQGSRRGANTLDVFQYLADELKLKPTVADKNGENVLHALARRPNQSETVKYFLAKGVDVNKANTEGNNAFMYAAAGKDAALLELLLPKVKNINAVNTKGESALTAAVKTSTPEVVSLLLKNGADVNIKDKDGNNVAYYLVQAYNPQAGRGPGGPTASIAGGAGNAQPDEFGAKIKLLQEKGLNLAAPQKDGSTLYHVAVTKNNVGLLKRLEPLNIDVNAKNKEGVTALHKAAMLSKDDAVLKYLLSVGAKKDLTTGFDETAYSLAKENELLTKKNVSLDFLK
ncbi:ankyrin repeat domain-containing protein [Adhaeribacter rhizoryzae]|uniref:Ankyrin repeat domain-containing protein n=1 Tax=Adhaeribacter rhizoryzae TaxID=2607907 RepID=A0A5M6D4B3_9BACT|nr:ankyrin repeat domain-containing protein [Adhaeribacter rhizoryzae]KAA5542321.1 ankyrin repeat domain-containing protein [Adhaeribacter rhizoryzae]